MADLATLDTEYCPDEAFDVELEGPDGAQLFNDDGTPMTIGVLGADSDVGVKTRNAASNRRLAQGLRMKMTAEGLDSEQASYLAKLSVRWNITMGGEKPAFSQDAALRLYANKKLSFIRDKVQAAIDERSNFLKRSPAT
jgi:hypothetical protein